MNLGRQQITLVQHFGTKGDAVTDDREAILRAFKASRCIYFSAGVYLLSDGIDLPESARLVGEGSPMLGPFPMKEDDKRFVQPGRLRELPGTSLVFQGRGRQSQETLRKDDFAEIR